ncbi:MAG: DUF3489 domain-containing protein [Bryobacteraceae bacterium]
MTTENTETNDTAAAVAEQGANVAPGKASAKKAATKKAATKKAAAKPAAKAAKKSVKKAPAAKATKKDAKSGDRPTFRQDSKSSIILGLLRRPKGATMAEIVKAVDWQKHSIRGFLSGNLVKKQGLKLESGKNAAGEHVYRIA